MGLLHEFLFWAHYALDKSFMNFARTYHEFSMIKINLDSSSLNFSKGYCADTSYFVQILDGHPERLIKRAFRCSEISKMLKE